MRVWTPGSSVALLALLGSSCAGGGAAIGVEAPPAPEEEVVEEGVIAPEALAAAEELIAVLNIEETLAVTTEAMLEGMIAGNPALAEFRDVFLEFFAEFMAWDLLKDDYASIYAEIYTVDEMRELADFYQTPLGQRLQETMPQLAVRGSQIGEAAVQPHLPELERRIMAAAMEAEAEPVQ
ncbi:MAG: DUF2059 domain-containing protein [Gemmatimonadota bacterium]